jgi:hypothetical protein
VTFLDASDVDRLLASTGFERIEHLDDRAVRARYAASAFGGEPYPFVRVVRAAVKVESHFVANHHVVAHSEPVAD